MVVVDADADADAGADAGAGVLEMPTPGGCSHELEPVRPSP